MWLVTFGQCPLFYSLFHILLYSIRTVSLYITGPDLIPNYSGLWSACHGLDDPGGHDVTSGDPVDLI